MQDPLGTIADAPSGSMPIGDSRFATHDIRLSAALCPLGFSLRLDAQPVGITINADTEKRVVTFYHQDQTKLGNFTARDVDLWWNSPTGKYTIVGYDDALTAMQRVGVERAQMINVAKHSPGYSRTKNMVVATTSLHTASVLSACGITLIGYDASGRQWIFSKGAEVIADLIKKGGKPTAMTRPLDNDLCIDWMIEWIRYRDWLAKLVKDPECIPMIEMRDGEHSALISRDMNEKDRNHMIARL